MKKNVITLIVLVVIAVILLALTTTNKTQKITPAEPVRATLTGVQVCLPHKNSDGPTTLECAYGLKTDAGEHYALNFALMSQTAPEIPNGSKLTATGLISSVTKELQKYDIQGVFSVTEGVKIEGTSSAPVELIGVWNWKQTILNTGERVFPKKPAFSITFNADGSITGTTDCNSFFGNVTVKKDTLVFGDFGMTKKFCDGSQEMQFVNMISNSKTYLVNAEGDLVLHIDTGSVVFTKK